MAGSSNASRQTHAAAVVALSLCVPTGELVFGLDKIANALAVCSDLLLYTAGEKALTLSRLTL